MRKGKTFASVAVLLVLVAALAGAQPQEEDEDGFWKVSAIGMDLRWKVEGEWLSVSVSASTTGWVAVGFNPTGKMKDANIIIGYVKDGVLTIRDDYGAAPTRHQSDEDIGGRNDISDAVGSESDGKTEISFRIKLDTGDKKDRPLKPGNTYKVIIAHGKNGADNFKAYHGNKRTTLEIKL